MDSMPNYLEYSELFDRYTREDLIKAWEALHNSDLETELSEEGSHLLVFFVDTGLQEMLSLYFQDEVEYDAYKNNYDLFDF